MLPCFAEPELSYSDLLERTKLPQEDLDRAVVSLALLKHKILLKVRD